MNYNHLHYFHVIAQEGTLSRASKRLHVSQPTLSGQLKLLEDYLETKLFDRTGGALRLNANGRRALEITQEMFRLGERLEEMFPGHRPPAKVRLEIGIATTVGRSFAVTRFVELFKSRRVMTRVRQGDHEFLFHELLGNGLDLLITDSLPERRNDRGTECRKLTSPEFVAVAASDFAGKLEDPTVGGLHHQPFIHYTSHSSYRFEIDQHFRDQRIEPRIVAEADDVYVIRDAVAAGIGAGIIPRAILDESPQRDGIRILGSMARKFDIFALYNCQDPSEEIIAALDILADPATKDPVA
ncbi:LysR substrate-binding domain-containing protein [Luteolibacter marinus]|uniref:LysR substrate-binding domain-containing protein n=1 Tax=Luteolibacter marinus TaxID=2776705 RepID=UPI0018679FE4